MEISSETVLLVELTNPLIQTPSQQRDTCERVRKICIASINTGFTLIGAIGLKDLATADYSSPDVNTTVVKSTAYIIFSLAGICFFKAISNMNDDD